MAHDLFYLLWIALTALQLLLAVLLLTLFSCSASTLGLPRFVGVVQQFGPCMIS